MYQYFGTGLAQYKTMNTDFITITIPRRHFMTLVQYAPARAARPSVPANRWNPAVDVVESDDRYTLTFDLPGLKREEITINLKEGVLSVTGERKPENQDDGNNYYRYMERSTGAFVRSFRLPEFADGENISAQYEQGVLTLEIPKKAEAKPRVITVK